MARRWVDAFLGVGLSGLLALTVSPTMAARKYYPKGFTPPLDALVLPDKPTPETDTPSGNTPPLPTALPTPHPAKPKDEVTVLLEARRFSEALRLVDERLKKTPADLNLKLLHAYIQREKAHYETAESEYQWVISHTNTRSLKAKAYSGLGWTQLSHARQTQRLGDNVGAELLLNKAHQSLQHALKEDPKLHTAWTGMAQLHLHRQKPEEAEHALTRAAALVPTDTWVLLTRGQYHIVDGSPNQALTFLFKAKQQSPLNAQVYLLLAQAYFGMNRMDDGIIQLQHLLDREPDHPEALKLMSQAYVNKMKPADAEAALQKAVFLNPGDVDAAMALLKSYDSGGDTHRSIVFLENLIQLAPTQGQYQEALLERLAWDNQWESVYEKGLNLLTSHWQNPANARASKPAMQAFLQAVYLHGKKQLNPEVMFTHHPALAKLRTSARQQATEAPHNGELRLGALLLDPTIPLPPATLAQPSDTAMTPVWIKIAYLQGDQTAHQQLLETYVNNPLPSAEARQQLATDLYTLGDYTGAKTLTTMLLRNTPDDTRLMTLDTDIQHAQKQAKTQLDGLKHLSSRLPETFWENNAQEALTWAGGNWQLHATLADTLWNRRDYAEALAQQRLAAQYAPNDKERSRWLKKAQKTQEKLNQLHPAGPGGEANSSYPASK